MKILQFIETGGPGGAEQVVLQLSQLLLARGHDVLVASLRHGWLSEQLHLLGIRHIHIESSSRFDFLLPVKIARLLKSEKVDIIHSHLLDSNFYGALAARIARVPHVASEHGDVHHTDTKRHLALKLWAISKLGTHCCAVSKYTANALRHFGVKNSQIIGNPIQIPEPNPETRATTRHNLGINEDSFVWVHIANLRPVKDQNTLLKAFLKLQKNSSKHQVLLMIGDGPLRSSLDHFVTSHNLQEHVFFLGFQKNASDFLAAADAFVLSSLSEALPMSLLEAGALRLPVVATAVGGIPEVIENGVSGFLVPENDPDSLASAMRTLCAEFPRSVDMGKQLYSIVEGRFEGSTIASKFEELYRNLTAKLP